MERLVRSSRSNSKNGRPTLAMVTRSVASEVATLEWAGTIRGARANHLNLICFATRDPFKDPTNDPTSSVMEDATPLFDLVDPAQFDGLILWTAMLGRFAEDGSLQAFVGKFHDLPCVTAEQALGATPTVSMDEYRGMWSAVEHLIVEHGCRRIAFLRGPADHAGLQVRYQAYVDCLTHHHIGIDPLLVTRACDFSAADAKEVILELLDGVSSQLPDTSPRGRPVDAIVGPSESFALGIMRALEERKITVPDGIAVVGFDDTFEMQRAIPPITTAVAPLAEIGERAVAAILELMQGNPVQQENALAVPLAVRQSCGCLDARLLRSASNIQSNAYQATLDETRSTILAELLEMQVGQEVLDGTLEFINQFAKVAQSDARTIPKHYLMHVTRTVRCLVRNSVELQLWLECLSGLRHFFNDRPLALDLWLVLSATVSHEGNQNMSVLLTQAKAKSHLLSSLASAMATFDFSKILRLLPQWLPQLGIPSCFIALYEHVNEPFKGAVLHFAYTDGQPHDLPEQGLSFTAQELVPSAYVPSNRSFSWLVELLTTDDAQAGFIVFETGPRDGIIYETLRMLICNGLMGSHLVASLRGRTRELEASLERLEQAQASLVQAEKMASLGSMVAGISHELNTPIGNALTTATTMLDRTRTMTERMGQGALRKSELMAFLEDKQQMEDLVVRSTVRSTELLARFKQVAEDRTSAQRRGFVVESVVEDVVAALRASLYKQSISVQIHIAESITCNSYPGPLGQVLTHLVQNAAIHAFPERPAGLISISVSRDREWAILSVRDDGIGMDAHTCKHAFDPFFTSRMGRTTGLGLSVAHRIATATLGGQLTVESTPGQGSCFSLRFCIDAPH